MSLANVTLDNTFDEWRVRTNQLIVLYDETNQLARSSYNATNLAVVTAANISANIISGNSAVYNTIYTNANTITLNVLTTIIPTFYDASNAAYDQSNTAITTSSFAYGQANTSRNTANITYNTANSAVLIANLAYDTANNFVANASNSVAEVLASNTAIQNTINTTATILVENFLANTTLGYVGDIANASFTAANAAFLKANTGDSTGVSAYDTANAAYTKANTAGGGYFVGNNGNVGAANNKGDIFRVNSNTLTGNVVFAPGENASATGPLNVADNATIEIQTGARVVIL